jgi:hypothetical protein
LRAIADIRVESLLDEDASPRATEGKIRKLEGECAAAEAEVKRLGSETSAIASAIGRLEAEVLPKRHKERLQDQAATRERYTDLARRLLAAANLLAELSTDAKAVYDAAYAKYPTDETMAGQDTVLRHGGLSPIFDYQWAKTGDNPTRRDHLAGVVWDFNPAIVPADDPAARQKQHQADFFAKWREENERKRQQMLNPPPPPPPPQETPRRPLTVGERLRGELVDQEKTIVRVRS